MKKKHLVLVHSFPTNSILLGGLVEYLDEYFVTHCIDLPGFTRASPPLPEVTLEGYSRFVEAEIRRLNLDDYVAAGVSFGFAVVNGLPIDERCRGILGIVPFLGSRSLRMDVSRRLFWRTVVKLIRYSGLSNRVWNSFIVRRYFKQLRGYRDEVCSTIVEQMDARTFFETAAILLTDGEVQPFRHAAYVLLAGRNDQTIDYDRIRRTAAATDKPIRLIDLEIDHYPQDMSKSYFQRMIPPDVVEQINEFFFSAR